MQLRYDQDTGKLLYIEMEASDFLEWKRAYQLAFTSPAGELVMKDLSKFCRVKATTKGDPLLEGRRQVYLHIQQILELSVEELLRAYPTLGDYDG